MKKSPRGVPKTRILLSLIILLAAVFRFYNFSGWVNFGMDQEYQSLLAQNILSGRHFPLIGVNASDTGIYLGPFFTYFTAIVQFLFHGDPIGGSLIASITGVLMVFILFKIGNLMFNIRVGLLASLFYAGSFLTSFYDRQFWNPVFVPISSLLIGYLLFQILENKFNRLPLLALILGLSIQSHLSILIFLPLIILVLIKKIRRINRKALLTSLIIFLLLQVPIIFFDVRHNFLNARAALNLLFHQNNNKNINNIPSRIGLFVESTSRFFWIPSFPDLLVESGQCKDIVNTRKLPIFWEKILMTILLSGGGFLLYKNIIKQRKIKHFTNLNQLRSSYYILFSLLVLTFLVILFYKREMFEYYYLYFFPWLAILVGLVIDKLMELNEARKYAKVFIILFIILNLFTLFTAKDSYSYFDKIHAAEFAKSFLQNRSYNLEVVGECTRFGGYRYLFSYYLDRPPIHSYMDIYYDWIYRDHIKAEKPERIVLLSLIDWRYNKEVIAKWEELKLNLLIENNLLVEKKFGNVKLYILEPINASK